MSHERIDIVVDVADALGCIPLPDLVSPADVTHTPHSGGEHPPEPPLDVVLRHPHRSVEAYIDEHIRPALFAALYREKDRIETNEYTAPRNEPDNYADFED